MGMGGVQGVRASPLMLLRNRMAIEKGLSREVSQRILVTVYEDRLLNTQHQLIVLYPINS